MDQGTVTTTLIGMMLVTYLPRVLRLWFFTSRALHPLVAAWLRYVPVAVLAAMLFPSLLVADGRVDVSLGNLFLLAAVPTAVVAARTRSLFGSVIVGVGTVAAARYLLGLQ